MIGCLVSYLRLKKKITYKLKGLVPDQRTDTRSEN